MDEIIVGFIGFVFSLASMGYLAVIFKEFFYSLKSMNWPAIRGEIILSELRFEEDENLKQYYNAIDYSYEINGEKHHSSTIYFGYGMTDDYSYHKKISDAYQTGSIVPVYYDPHHTNSSVLIKGVNTILYFKFGITLVFFIVGSVMLMTSIL